MTNRTKSIKLGAVAIGFLAGLNGSTALADQVILDDLIVNGSACIGQDCVNGESFGFDTLRLKENNLRIKAQDTSNSASFPTNDWQITFNDSGNGGQNKFSIDDIDGGRTPFTIEATAPSHSLYVDDGGRIGLGTATPVVELHVVNGDSPTLRLEQNGSSGFTPQTFDVAANESNFFVRDVTNGSQLPFRIVPGADTNSLAIAADNNVGIGILAPSAQLHVRQGDGTAAILVEEISGTQAGRGMLKLKNNGGSFIEMENTAASAGTGETWFFTHENNAPNRFIISHTSLGGAEFILDVDGNLTLGGTITTSGSCSTPCDKVFAADYELPSIEDHTAAMWENGYLPNVGPTPEQGQYDLSDKVLRMLNELEHAHIYISQMNDEVAEMRAQVASLEAKLESNN